METIQVVLPAYFMLQGKINLFINYINIFFHKFAPTRYLLH